MKHYLADYRGVVRTGFWEERRREDGKTSSYEGIEDSWVELEMLLGHLPSFMQIVGHPVILDIETPEILTLTKPEWRRTVHRWRIWSGPPRPAYRLTIYDDYRE